MEKDFTVMNRKSIRNAEADIAASGRSFSRDKMVCNIRNQMRSHIILLGTENCPNG